MPLLDKELIQKIGRPRNACLDCGASIENQSRHPSALLAPGETDPKGESLRRDFCEACWNGHREDSYLGHWIARREPPKPKPIRTRKQRNVALLNYFHEISNGAHAFADREAARFFLAHLLMRYGVFKWTSNDETHSDGTLRILFKSQGTDDLVSVESRELSDEQLTEFQQAMELYLHEYRPPETAAAVPSMEPEETSEVSDGDAASVED